MSLWIVVWLACSSSMSCLDSVFDKCSEKTAFYSDAKPALKKANETGGRIFKVESKTQLPDDAYISGGCKWKQIWVSEAREWMDAVKEKASCKEETILSVKELNVTPAQSFEILESSVPWSR